MPGEDVVHPSGDALGARVRGVYQHPPSLHPLGGHRVDERALLRVELLLRRPKSSLTVAATNIGDGTKAPGPFDVRLNDRLIQFPPVAMEAAKPGSRSRSTKVFCGWLRAGAQRAGRQAVGPAVFPAPAFHCAERTSTHVAQPAASRPSTNARPKEMPMKQREPGEPGRTAEEPGPGAPPPRFRGSGYRASIRRPKPPGPPNNGPPKHSPEGDDS